MNRRPIKAKRAPRNQGLMTKVAGLLSPEQAVPEIVVVQEYRKFIRRLPCAVCSTRKGVEFAHQGSKGMSQKTTDYSGVPLCAHCHLTGKYAQHQMGKAFWAYHKIDVDALIEQLNHCFRLLKSPLMDEGEDK